MRFRLLSLAAAAALILPVFACGRGRTTDEIVIGEYGSLTGGIATFGSLVLHDLAEDVTSTHLLQFDLPPGWVPDDPWDSRWEYGANAIEFPADDLLRLLLPGGHWAQLRLPLPEAVLLPTPARELPARQ